MQRVADPLAEREPVYPAVRGQNAAGQGMRVQMLQHVQTHPVFLFFNGVDGRIVQKMIGQEIDHRGKVSFRDRLKTPVGMVPAELAHLVALPAQFAAGHGHERFRPVQIVRVFALFEDLTVRKQLPEHGNVRLRNGREIHGAVPLALTNQFFKSRAVVPAHRQGVVRDTLLVVQADEQRGVLHAVIHAAGVPPHEQTARSGIAFAAGKKRYERPQFLCGVPRHFFELHFVSP